MRLWQRAVCECIVAWLVVSGLLPGTTLAADAKREFVASEKQRVIVLTDISNEPDDEQSLVRFLVYSNEYDVEGLIATTSVWLRDTVRPERIRERIEAYGRVRDNLLKHASGYPTAEHLLSVTRQGLPEFGLDGVGEGRAPKGPVTSSRWWTSPTNDPCGLASGAGPTALRRRCGTSSIREAPKRWRRSYPNCGSIPSPTRTTRAAGCGSPSRTCSTS